MLTNIITSATKAIAAMHIALYNLYLDILHMSTECIIQKNTNKKILYTLRVIYALSL